ncbi:ubiquitin-conjugating enzyme/RWD-like protein [Xylaria sp. CBS 124048]|nr:ubiquitin-conjugating enzyme/RWD-like protein [Xylaria sp. CBS 124048]
MASLSLTKLPALRRQHLLAEFTGLKQACPEGVYVGLTPGDPTLWSGVIFVRDGPYAPAVMRFQLAFPDSYPELPPLVTFATDLFHPLITPPGTYTHSIDVQDNGTISANDEEPLPPGGFSLKHGFPNWFRRRGRKAAEEKPAGGDEGARQTLHLPPPPADHHGGTAPGSRNSAIGQSADFLESKGKEASIFEILHYIRSTFDNEDVLDSIPLEAAGNQGAWHAWRAHRTETGKEFVTSPTSPPDDTTPMADLETSQASTRQPGQWSWEGVWEDRVSKGIAISLSEPVMFGSVGTPDEVIRFLNMGDDDLVTLKENLLRTLDYPS